MELPKYPAGAGPAIGHRLRQRRQETAAARADLSYELAKLEDQAATTFADLDAREATRQRLTGLAREQREVNRGARR
ncbi:hypothetical protein [Lacisediminihabitans sp. H27-G8]|uniref:hypothetical protein n=1 Tax=Lacisediminihabitans sp. H27-G8 TaxID=3111909 RepID=UPI0038FCDEAD